MVIVFDLDDTLYDEIDFVKSGLKEIANYLKDPKYYDFMLNVFENEGSGKVFNKLIEKFNLEISLQKLIEIYRFHIPNIRLPRESRDILKFSQKYETAIITDGHYITQRNKFNVLNLKKFIDFTVFTDFYHTKKTELKPFEMIMKQFKAKKYIYIADNPKKDFLVPNKLSWNTIRFKNPNGIYKDLPNDAIYEVEKRGNILNIFKNILHE